MATNEKSKGIEAEYEVISTIINNPAYFDDADLTTDDFSDLCCKEAFATVSALIENTRPTHLDVLLVYDALPKNGRVRASGGLKWLSELQESAIGIPQNLSRYAQILKRNAIDRKIDRIGAKAALLANDNQLSSDEKLEVITQMVDSISTDAQPEQTQTIVRSVVDSYLAELEKRESQELPGMSTGLDGLDKALGGLKTKQLYVLGARPSMGKTGLAVNIGIHVASLMSSIYGEVPHGVLVKSQEMPTQSIMDRMVAGVGSINLSRLIAGKLDEYEYSRLSAAVGKLYDLPLWIDDKPALTLLDIRKSLKSLKKENVKLIVIDYLQLMQGHGDNRNAQIEAISRGLKQIAIEFDVAVLLLSQLSRKVEERSDKRPMNSDLRDSGSIEQDADVIMFIYRDEVYKKDSPEKGIAEIIVSKNRNGPLATIKTAFTAEYVRFNDLT